MPVVAGRGGSVSQPDDRAQFRFPRTDRLTLRRQFRTVYDTGRRVRGRCVTVFGLPNDLGRCRRGPEKQSRGRERVSCEKPLFARAIHPERP